MYANLRSGSHCMLSKPELRRLGFAFRELLSQSNPPPDSLLALIKSAAEYPFGERTFNALRRLQKRDFTSPYITLTHTTRRRDGDPVLKIKIRNPFLGRVTFSALLNGDFPREKSLRSFSEKSR